MSISDQTKSYELAVFLEFTDVCPLHLLIGKVIQPNPDPPDILCPLEDGTQLAFELVSCEDEIGLDKWGHEIAWTRGINDQIALRKLLREEYAKAIKENRIDRPERFESSAVHVEFEQGAVLKQRRGATSRAIDLLNVLGTGRHFPSNDSPIRSITCTPLPNRIANDCIPSFSVDSSYFHVANTTVDRVAAKINQSSTYKFDFPVHLLTYSHSASAAESEFWRDDLVTHLRSTGMGRFERIWVFGKAEKSV